MGQSMLSEACPFWIKKYDYHLLNDSCLRADKMCPKSHFTQLADTKTEGILMNAGAEVTVISS